jgi:hypothetical protein
MKYRFVIFGICGLFILSIHAHGQYKYTPVQQQQGICLTGSLQCDLEMNIDRDLLSDSIRATNKTVMKKTRYSPLAAGLYSAVLPGAGQFYTKSYWQSAAFFGAEVLAWVVYATYEKKGDRQTNDFQQYADEHWSVAQYAAWINLNFGKTININSDQSLKSWEKVQWAELNTAEDQIASDQSIQPTGFTHKLAPHGDQQFYEMIGKYSQFGGGWDDATSYTRADVIANNGIGNVSPRFLAYSDMRGKANSYYNIGTTVSYVIVANHVFSALEAALNASKINHRIQLQGHIQSRRIYGNLVEFVPTLNVKYEL